jgi:hypothetical protein
MDTRDDCRCGHEFVLVLSGVTEVDDRIADALFEAGCDDATPSVRFGRVYLSFDREARSLREAILSAIRDVLNAGIGAGVRYVDDCNLVSQAEIARRINRSRQLVGQYLSGQRGPGNFPGPVCSLTEGHPLWMWCEVSYWLWQNNLVKEEVLNNSRVVAAINSVLEYRHQAGHDAGLTEEVLRLVEGSPSSCPA